MRYMNRLGKEHLGAALIIALGAAVLLLGLTYETGTLRQMGAGFLPVTFGGLMIAVGLAMGLNAAALSSRTVADPASVHPRQAPQWRGWACIVGGVVAFVVLGRFGGLVPATFFSVFVAALGDRENSLRSATALATVVDIFSVAVFHYGLRVQLPLFQWA
jgi:hypothetical protein